jgi:bifunctional non-homologous end joining protein LigD
VIQEHHARSLHWDFRLERDGVLVSWAVPKGLPMERGVNHLAVHVEDHPLEYGSFSGTIPDHEYGAGTVVIWDSGTYECTQWSDEEVKVRLDGARVKGRYGLFRTDGDNWMVHRVDPAPTGWQRVPELVRPMLATPAHVLPVDDDAWAYEFKWDGVRAVVYVEGGRVRALSRTDRDVTASYPELRGLGEALGSFQAVLDGEIVALDSEGRPSFEALQPRMNLVAPGRVRRLAETVPVTYMIFDLMHLDGHSALGLAYEERRRLLESLELAGPHWATSPSESGGAVMLEASRDAGLEGVVAKRIDSPYRPGVRDPSWRKIKNFRTQSVVVGGWAVGQGHLEGELGALLLGIPGATGLDYVGRVGTGFNAAERTRLRRRLSELARGSSPFVGVVPRTEAAGVSWVEPRLVGEVRFSEWTRSGRLRQPAWRGLRPDQRPEEVVVEP